MESAVERAVRDQIMQWVGARASQNGGFLRRDELLGYELSGTRLPIIDITRGIRNPRDFSSTLSIVASATGPYDDIESDDGLLHYAYEQGDPEGGANRKLRNAISTGQPLLLFRKEIPNIYTPIFPVFVIEDRPSERAFIIAFDESFTLLPATGSLTEAQRSYAYRLAKQRLHQPAFRTRVLVAYETQCSVCRIKHGSLLDAAHIIPDADDRGAPTVDNGLALCKIHHAAYDQNMLGLDPDYRVHINKKLLLEKDGPMLKHGLQEMHGRQLWVPPVRSQQPDREALSERFQVFNAQNQ